MSWPGFLAPMNALLFLLLIPLIIFYFLKLKRPRVEIPSLALWRQVINDQRVNSPFQKFKRNLLLLLQLLVLVCLILAAMQPFMPSGAGEAVNIPVIIDKSASMAAREQPGGPTRLDVVKQEVQRLIDNLLPEQRLSIITVGATPQRLTEFTNNQRVLRAALDRIEVEEVPSRLEDALRMTQALSRTNSFQSVILYTDGNVPARINFELPFDVNYQLMPAGGANIGVTAVNARRTGASRWDVFVRVGGISGKQTAADVQLLQDGQVLDSQNVVLEARTDQRLDVNVDEPQTESIIDEMQSGDGPTARLIFSVDADAATALEVRLIPDGFDALEADNVAYLDLPVSRPLTVYCPLGLSSYRHALRARADVVVYPDDEGNGNAASYDLLITDVVSESELDAAVKLLVGLVPREVQPYVAIDSGVAEVVDWDRNCQLLQHVLLSDVQIVDEPKYATGASDGDLEEQGFEVLAFGRTGPLILQRRLGQKLEYNLLFHSDHSTLVYRVGFPIMVANAVEAAMMQAQLSEIRGAPTGTLPPTNLAAGTQFRVSGPGGVDETVQTSETGVLAGVAAPAVGRYVVYDGGRAVANLGVSLLSAGETSLRVVDRLDFSEVSVAAADTPLKSDKPLWTWFAVIAFGALLVEWWYFQRRPGGALAR